jgi:asparagine synthase (glutamine-hydrolysing)
MSGIAGIISRRPASECLPLVKAMVASMEHETFYVSGTHSVPEMGIHAGWVAQEDFFAAGQPFLNEREDVTLIFSGECFLDSQTGVELRQKGHQIGTDKASWLVHLYEEEGEAFVKRLNGLFSGVLIDQRKQRVFLFNDRYGMERIYWHETADAFYFASEAKALLRVLPELRAFDEKGVAQFLAFGCTMEARTLFRGIAMLPGGSLWSFENGTCARQGYFFPATWESQPVLSAGAFECEFQSTFKRILPRYTETEMKLGISLTAGLDTRMIMAGLPGTARIPICYTYSGQATDTLDTRLAKRVAAACGLEHKTLRIGPDFLSDFPIWADRTIYTTDGCFGISGAHEIYLSRQARELSPVRLTGVFGGEILREVSTFKPINLSKELLHPEIRLLANAMVERMRDGNKHPVTFAAFKGIPWNMFGTVMACRSQLCLRAPYLDNELVGLAYRMPLDLRKSSDSAVRFIRNNNKAVGNIPTDMGYLGPASTLASVFNRKVAKVLFKFDYHYNHGLPAKLSLLEPVFRRVAAALQKFGSHRYLRYHNWFRKELASYIKETLTDAQTLQGPFWDGDVLKRVAEEHISGRKNYSEEINAVLTLESIERQLFRDLPRGIESGWCEGDMNREFHASPNLV